jgi:Virulence-associated protein E
MPAVGTIYDTLAAHGIQRTRGKMTCSQCREQKVTASESKGIAKCWGCGAAWTVSGETLSTDHDWATYAIGTIASRCQTHLLQCREALDWLEHRRLPIEDKRWLLDMDLGAVPPSLYISDVVTQARHMHAQGESARQEKIKLLHTAAAGKGVKERRAAEAKAEVINAAIDADRKEMEHLTKVILPILTEPFWRNAVVYIYRDADGEPCSLNLRQYSTEPTDRKVMRIQPHQGKRGVFGVPDAQFEPGDAWKGRIPLLTVVEGEHNRLSLAAAVRRWEVQYHVPCVAIGGKNGADIACLQTLAAGDEPLVIYDNDKVNHATGLPGGYELVDAVSGTMYCRAATTSTKDLDDYIKADRSLTPDKLHCEVFAPAKPVPLAITTIRDQVGKLLGAGDIEANALEIAVTNLITRDATRRCRLFNVDGYAVLLRPGTNTTSDLIPVRRGDSALEDFLKEYGIARKEWIDACGRAINIEASKLSTPRKTLHPISAWVGGKLYINCYEGSMVRIAVEDGKPVLTRVPVGTDGVLMQRFAHDLDDQEAATQPWLRSPTDLTSINPGALRHRRESLLDEVVLDKIIYLERPDHYKQILKCWIMSTFFATTQKSRPVPMFEGVGGGGKSSLGVALGNILIGDRFATTNSPESGKELAELMTGTPFVVFDEWDKVSKDVEKAFKHLTTGGKHKRRELYTTAEVVELGCTASIMQTTNSNPTREAATSRRNLVIPVAARQQEVGECVFHSVGDHLLPELMSMRQAVWLELLSDLSACVVALHKTDPATKTSFSMSDFGVFVQRIANYEKWGDAAHQMFMTTERKQEQQTADTQVIAELLPELLSSSPDLQGKFYTAKEWAEHFQHVIAEHDIDRRRMVNTNYVAYKFKTLADLYRRRFGLQEVENKHTKIKTYALSLPVETVEHQEAA